MKCPSKISQRCLKTEMKIFECPTCGSKDVFVEKSGNQTGLYCGDCGKWIKWITKDELRLVNRQIELMKDSVVSQFLESFKGEPHA